MTKGKKKGSGVVLSAHPCRCCLPGPVWQARCLHRLYKLAI